MADVATMKLELDASGALRSVEDLGRKLLGIQPKANSSGDALVAFGSDAGTAANQTQKLGDALGKTGERAGEASGKLVSAGKGAKEAEKSFQGLEKTGNELGKKIAALGLGLAAAEFVKLADASTMLEGRLKVLGLQGAALASTQEQLRNVANQTRTSFADVVELYSRLQRSSANLGVTQKDLLTVTTAVNQAAIVSGATQEEASNAIRQLAQGFASGTLRGDELNAVMEQLPRVAQAITAELGITTGELRKMAAEGQITSKEVFDALLKQAPQLAGEFAKVPVTMSSAMTLLKNAAQEAATQFEQTTGLTAKLAEGMAWAAKNTDVLVAVLGTAGLAGALVLAGNAVVAFSAKVAAGSIALAPLALGFAAVAASAAAFYQILKLNSISKESKEIDEYTKALNAQVKTRNELIASGIEAAEVDRQMAEQFKGALIAGRLTAPVIKQNADANKELAEKAKKAAEELAKQRAELAKLREEFQLRSTAAMDMFGAGTADLRQQIRERDEYTNAVEKGANLELRLLIALTQAREEYRKALDTTGLSGLPLKTLESKPVAVVKPTEETMSAWENFTAKIGLLFSGIGDTFADTLLSTFDRIAQRGRATFGDLFAGLSNIARSNTNAGRALGGATGASVFGVGALIANFVASQRAQFRAAQKLVKDQFNGLLDSFGSFAKSFQRTGGEFQRELSRIAEFVQQSTKDIDAILTVTARRALGRAGGDIDAAIAELQTRVAAGNTSLDVAIKQLEAYKKAQDELNAVQRDAINAAREAQKQRLADLKDDLAVRLLAAQGRTEEADALRRQLERQAEVTAAFREFGVVQGAVVASMLAGIYAAEDAARVAAEERDRARTIAGLDIDIARERGDDAEVRRLEREQILADVTDEVIRAKYEELFAAQDFNRAVREAAEAAQLLAEQQIKAEDLEVRRLVATGDAIAAEELRFALEQQRELRRAEADLALGKITQEIFDRLREVLDLEAAAFGRRNEQAPLDPTSSASAVSQRGGVGQVSNLATAQVQDIDRVVGELSTIRIRAGQLVQLMTSLVRGGGILGAVNAGIQRQTNGQSLINGDLVVA